MPEKTWYHTLNGFLSCGGVSALAGQTDLHCTNYRPERGDWQEEPYSLSRARYHHASWSLSSGQVMLLGGSVSPNTTELINPGQNSSPAFSLGHDTL